MNPSVHFAPPAYHKRPGFTLIELLVVVLVLGILMVIAVPTYNGAVADSQHRVCRANMQTIANADVAYHARSVPRVFTADLAAAGLLSADLGSIPKCPNGGTYTITDGSGAALTAASTIFTVHCSSNGSGGAASATCVTTGQAASPACIAPMHDAPYVATEPAGFTQGVNSQ